MDVFKTCVLGIILRNMDLSGRQQFPEPERNVPVPRWVGHCNVLGKVIRYISIVRADARVSFSDLLRPFQDDGSAAKGTVSSAGGFNRDRSAKGKGRQVLAMERRRSLAAQATRLQEQQQREAEVRAPLQQLLHTYR